MIKNFLIYQARQGVKAMLSLVWWINTIFSQVIFSQVIN